MTVSNFDHTEDGTKMYEDQLTDDVKNIEANINKPRNDKEAKLEKDNSGFVTERESMLEGTLVKNDQQKSQKDLDNSIQGRFSVYCKIKFCTTPEKNPHRFKPSTRSNSKSCADDPLKAHRSLPNERNL